MSYNVYIGGQSDLNVNPTSAVPLSKFPRDPNPYDTQNFTTGWHWLNTQNQALWYLAQLSYNPPSNQFRATWLQLSASTGDLLKLTSNSGGPVYPLSGNINVVGDGTTIVGVGNPATNSITFSVVGGGVVTETITGDSGGAVAPTAGNINLKQGSLNGTPQFIGTLATSTLDLQFTDADQNTVFGTTAFKTSHTPAVAVANTGIGFDVLNAITTGADNTAVGQDCLNLATTGSNNTAVGVSALQTTTGGHNIAIGATAGNSYVSSESSNIVIGNTGTASESNTIRIGTNGSGAGQQSACFIAGISGVTVSNEQLVTINTSTGQLGSIAGTGAGSLILLQTQTASGVAALNFTTGISSTYNNYLLLIDGVSCSTASSNILCAQLSTNGGSTYIATGYTDSSGAEIGLTLATLTDSTANINASVALLNVTSGSKYIMSSGTFANYDTSGPSFSSNTIGSVYATASTTANALRVVIDGTKTWSGTVSLYGYVK